jgi:hypothetical protein
MTLSMSIRLGPAAAMAADARAEAAGLPTGKAAPVEHAGWATSGRRRLQPALGSVGARGQARFAARPAPGRRKTAEISPPESLQRIRAPHPWEGPSEAGLRPNLGDLLKPASLRSGP